MRHPILIGASVLVAAALALAPAARAQCNEGLKVGNSYDFAVASEDKSIAGKGTIKVTKFDGSYVEFSVTSGNATIMMPGGVDGNHAPPRGSVAIRHLFRASWRAILKPQS